MVMIEDEPTDSELRAMELATRRAEINASLAENLPPASKRPRTDDPMDLDDIPDHILIAAARAAEHNLVMNSTPGAMNRSPKQVAAGSRYKPNYRHYRRKRTYKPNYYRRSGTPESTYVYTPPPAVAVGGFGYSGTPVRSGVPGFVFPQSNSYQFPGVVGGYSNAGVVPLLPTPGYSDVVTYNAY